MKTIKTRSVSFSILIVVILSQSACRTSKLTDRQQTRSSEAELFDIRSRGQQSTKLSRSSTITDSSGQFYQVTIFPADTFHFSMRDGFRGKALKIVVKGSKQELMQIAEFESIRNTRDSSKTVKSVHKIESEESSVIKSVKRKNIALLVLCLASGLALLIGFVWKRFSRSRV